MVPVTARPAYCLTTWAITRSGQPTSRGRPPVPLWRVRKAFRTTSMYVRNPSLTNSRRFHGRNRTAVANQGHHAGDRVLVGAPPIEDRPSPRAERFAADLAPIALALLAMDADVPLAHLSPCGAVHVRAECRLRIDGAPP